MGGASAQHRTIESAPNIRPSLGILPIEQDGPIPKSGCEASDSGATSQTANRKPHDALFRRAEESWTIMTEQIAYTPPYLRDSADPAVRFLDDLEVGDRWETRGRTIVEADLLTFGTWSGDMHPLHTNEEYARRTEFGGRIFHGPGAMAIAFGLEMSLGWKLGSAIAFLGIREWNLLAPIRIGDTIHVVEEVIDVRTSRSKPDRGVVATRVQILNQTGLVCHEGIWTVLLRRRPDRNSQ